MTHPTKPQGETPLELPIDFAHYPADAQEGWEMICRAKVIVDRLERALSECREELERIGTRFPNARDAHYFKDGRSICGRWMSFGGPRWEENQSLGNAPTPGTCKTCWKRVAKLKQGEPR